MIRIRPIAILAALMLATSLAACARTAVLTPPLTSSFETMPTHEIESAILEGCARRGWVPRRLSAGSLEATLTLRVHKLVVRIDYTKDAFTITYVSSENLQYQKDPAGQELVHRNANSWIQNLQKDIQIAIEKQRILGPHEAPEVGAAAAKPKLSPSGSATAPR
jgi:hypothetical protein